jgi:flagellar protein FliJ
MKKFRFRLEPILKIKDHTEKQKQKDHAAALQNVYRQQDALTAIDRERSRTFEFQRTQLVGPMKAYQVLASTRYLVKLKRDTLMGTELLKGMEREAERKRQALVEASRERKIYEKLKERQRTAFLQDIEQTERKVLDEMAVVTFAHRRRH